MCNFGFEFRRNVLFSLIKSRAPPISTPTPHSMGFPIKWFSLNSTIHRLKSFLKPYNIWSRSHLDTWWSIWCPNANNAFYAKNNGKMTEIFVLAYIILLIRVMNDPSLFDHFVILSLCLLLWHDDTHQRYILKIIEYSKMKKSVTATSPVVTFIITILFLFPALPLLLA